MDQRPITSYMHGMMDYGAGVLLLLAPELLQFAGLNGNAELVARTLGALVLLQAAITDYELGLFNIISLRSHVLLDYLLGAFLAVSPWLFAFNAQPVNIWVPHVVMGVMLVLIASLSEQHARGHAMLHSL